MKGMGAMLALAPALAWAQDLRISGFEESPGTVLGRACIDQDGD